MLACLRGQFLLLPSLISCLLHRGKLIVPSAYIHYSKWRFENTILGVVSKVEDRLVNRNHIFFILISLLFFILPWLSLDQQHSTRSSLLAWFVIIFEHFVQEVVTYTYVVLFILQVRSFSSFLLSLLDESFNLVWTQRVCNLPKEISIYWFVFIKIRKVVKDFRAWLGDHSKAPLKW